MRLDRDANDAAVVPHVGADHWRFQLEQCKELIGVVADAATDDEDVRPDEAFGVGEVFLEAGDPLGPGQVLPNACSGRRRFITNIYPDVRFELLNYNPLAAAKYDVLPGVLYVFDTDANPKMFNREQLAGFHEIARANGVRNLVTT